MNKYIIITNLSDRLSSPGFSSEIKDGMSMSMYSYYMCACGQRVRFNAKNLEKAERNPRSTLAETEQLAISDAAKGFIEQHDDFLDFYCPNCHKPIRLYFRSWAGGRHGDGGMHWRFIVEKE